MRIRSIKPEFWRSDDIGALAWCDRLLFIGLWSYVDDNGVGRDSEKLIVADLFPLEDDPRDTLATVSRGLANLAAAGLIDRYDVDGRAYLHVHAWDDHQRIDKPNKPRYPLPTSGNAVPREDDAEPSRHSRDSLAPGAVEQRSSGTEEQGELLPSPAAPSRTRDPIGFPEFWDHYPRKVGKDAARKAFTTAARRAPWQRIVIGAQSLANDPNLPDPQFIPHPASWLNAGRWDDEPLPARTDGRTTPDTRVRAGLALAQQLRDTEPRPTLTQIGTR